MGRFGMLLAYDAAGNVIQTKDWKVRYDKAGRPIELVDFAAHEAAGDEMTAYWTVPGAKGSKVWPEYLGGAAHNYRVELDGQPGRKYIAALVHRITGERRERAAIERRIAERIAAANGGPADLRDIVGGPDRPLRLPGAPTVGTGTRPTGGAASRSASRPRLPG